MANIIKLKRSGVGSTVPTTLEVGELALNYADGRIYYKDSDGTIQYFQQTGPKGQKGEIGAGDKGQKGEAGPAGADSTVAGPAGTKGATGAGVKGVTGPTGVKGSIGPQAIKGEQGVQGIKGTTGNQGDTGTKGQKGDTGTKGDLGNNLYYKGEVSYTNFETYEATGAGNKVVADLEDYAAKISIGYKF